MNEENRKHCEAIAEELKRIYNGEYFNYNGEALPYDINAEYWKNNYWGYTAGLTDDGEEIYLLDGEALAPEDLEPYTMWDYFGDCLDIDYILDSNREFKACRIMVACGGPNIYINTWENKIELYWWTERAEAWLPSEVCQEINAVFGELFYC